MANLVINPELLGLDHLRDLVHEQMRSYLRDVPLMTERPTGRDRPSDREWDWRSFSWGLRLSVLRFCAEGTLDGGNWRDHPTIKDLAGLLRESAEHSSLLPLPGWLRRYMADRFDGTLHLRRGRKPNRKPRDPVLERLHLFWRVEEKYWQYKRNGVKDASVERVVGEVAVELDCQLDLDTLLKYRRMALRRDDVRPLLLWARRPDERNAFDEARVEDVTVGDLSLWARLAPSTSGFSDQAIRAILRRVICGPRKQD